MEAVKRSFGVLMLAMAIWIVSPVIPVSAQMLLWAALLIFIGDLSACARPVAA